MCHPKDLQDIKKPKEIEISDEIDLPDIIPEDTLFVNETVSNQNDEILGHVISIEGVEYALYVDEHNA